MTDTPKPTGLALMREPFKGSEISKLPKPTRAQTDKVKQDYKQGIRCKICGGWHHKDVVHLDYVGHAALTDRLLECDSAWNWEPLSFNDQGLPMLDNNGGMWIRLTVCDQSRLGYGNADGKKGGDAVKELIGDALRNAAMRFGAALDLWHKGDLHADEGPEIIGKPDPQQESQQPEPEPQPTPVGHTGKRDELINALNDQAEPGHLYNVWTNGNFNSVKAGLPEPMQLEVKTVYDRRKEELANV